jgi:predicted dehydrogenase/flavin reductase (DIM6/NTAB) family NADH-FMN oxidoreductase RutF
MHWLGRTIWDTRIQSVCGILSANGDDGVEVYFSATFAQVSLSPARVIVNPNRMYAIEDAIRKSRRFAINVVPLVERDKLTRLMRLRRRQPNKTELLGLEICEDAHGIPFLKESLRTVFCEVESEIPSGDRQLYLARVLESRANPKYTGQRPLLFGEITSSGFPFLRKAVRTTAIVTGGLDLAKKLAAWLRPLPPANIAKTTYEQAGATESELKLIRSYGLLDRGHTLTPAAAPAILSRKVGVCVVGTGWGSFHCRVVQRASPNARLFVCGQNEERTARLARAVGAEGFFVGLENAAADPRIQALTLALPHDLHRQAAEIVAAAGKHALVEKPIATNLADADAMIATANRAGTILMVAEDMHFRPAIKEAFRRIAQGDIGEPLYFMAHAAGVRRPRGWAANAERMGGGVLMDIGVHYVRGLRLLMGEPDSVVAARAMQVDTKISGEDSIQVLFSSEFGWQAHMLLSWATLRGHAPDIVVAGEKGTLHLWPGTSYLDFYPVSPPLISRLCSYIRPYWVQAKLMRAQFGRVRVSLRDKEGSGYLGEVREFLAAVAEGREPASPPEDGRRDLEIVLHCYDALAKQTRVSIPQVAMPKVDWRARS